MKKFLSILLMICMLISSVSTVVLAADGEQTDIAAGVQENKAETVTENSYDTAVAILGALGIMNGKSETNFGADDFLTRAEMCAAIIRFVGLETENEGDVKSRYTDVDDEHWAKYYIELASNLGLVNGNGDGTFDPDAEVTTEQAVKVVVCALGYTPMAETKGGYPTGYTAVASQLDLYDGISGLTFTASIPRWQLALLLYNALEVDLLEPVIYNNDGNQESAIVDGNNALYVYHRIGVDMGTVTATDSSSIDGTELRENRVMINGKQYIANAGIGSYVGHYVKYYYKIDKSAAVEEIVAFSVITDEDDKNAINFDDVYSVNVDSSMNVEITYYKNDGSSKTSVDSIKPSIVYNGQQVTFADNKEAETFLNSHRSQGQYTLMDKANDNYENLLFVENYDAYVVQAINNVDEKIIYNIYRAGRTDSGYLDLSSTEYEIYGENNGKITINDLVKDDVVMIYTTADKKLTKVYKCTSQVSGVVEKTKLTSGTVGGTVSGGGSTPPAATPAYELISVLTMDGFEAEKTDATAAYDGFRKRVDGKPMDSSTSDRDTHHVYGYSEGGNRINTTNTNIVPISGLANANMPGVETNIPEVAGTNVMRFNKQEFRGRAGASDEASLRVENFCDLNDIRNGDNLKVTAYLYADMPYADGKPAANADSVDEFNLRMWISQKREYGRINYNQNDIDPSKPDESIVCTIPRGEWVEVSLEFDFDTNLRGKVANSLRIDNQLGNGLDTYPAELILAGIKVEKLPLDLNPPPTIHETPTVNLGDAKHDIYIDGQKYAPAAGFSTELIDARDTVTLFLDKFGKIVGYTKTEVATGYALLMDVAYEDTGFGEKLRVKLMDANGSINIYDTKDEIRAWDKASDKVIKRNIKDLITKDPIDIMTTDYLWSTNNASNFKCTDRSWLTNSKRSDVANQRIIYYKTNSNKEITEILLPSMPETNPESKITIINPFGIQVMHAFWPQFYTLVLPSSHDQQFMFQMSKNALKYVAMAEDYEDDDYRATTGQMWEESETYDRNWMHAQLYKKPGSKSVDFIFTNTRDAHWKSSYIVLVDHIEQKADGTYKLYSVKPALTTSKFDYDIKPDLRLFENIWTSGLDPAKDEILTADNIKNYTGVLPYNVSYEHPMVGEETPYVTPETVHPGDVAIVLVENSKITYMEIVRRAGSGLVTAYNGINAGSANSGYYTNKTFTNGVVTEINNHLGTIKIEGYYWLHPDKPISSSADLYVQAAPGYTWETAFNARSSIQQMTLDFNVFEDLVVYYEDTQEWVAGTFRDIEIGDKFLVIGSNDYPRGTIVFKNKR